MQGYVRPFDHQREITMKKGIKAKGKVEKAAFDF